jgi:hypothetical protein
LSEDEETIEKIETKPEEKIRNQEIEEEYQEIENKEPRNSELVTSKIHFARNSIFNKQSKSICGMNLEYNFPLMDIELSTNGPFKIETKGMPSRKEVRSIRSLNSQCSSERKSMLDDKFKLIGADLRKSLLNRIDSEFQNCKKLALSKISR